MVKTCDFCDRDELKARLAEAERERDALQKALSFWHPGVMEFLTPEQAKRAAHDAYLLYGCVADIEPSAAELGWIRWTSETVSERVKS